MTEYELAMKNISDLRIALGAIETMIEELSDGIDQIDCALQNERDRADVLCDELEILRSDIAST